MSIIEQLKSRSGSQCELTGLTEDLLVYTLPPATSESIEHSILVNASVAAQLEGKEPLDVALYEGTLSGSMWSEIPAVQITVWRLLQRLKSETWASDLIDMLYLDEEMLAWAQSGGEIQEAGVSEIHKDANGVPLATGDSVVLTKSLDVKGSSLNARIGTVVKNIRLVPDNTDQIEGKIEGQLIVILTKYVKKHS